MKIEHYYESRIVARGKDYTDNVNFCIRIGNNLYAEVEGSATYKTQVDLQNLDGKCTCPYRNNCKHAVATYLVYEAGGAINGDKFIDHLYTLNKTQLIKIIIDNIKHNPQIVLDQNPHDSNEMERLVEEFINNFSYSKLKKVEKLVKNLDFNQLLRTLNFLQEYDETISDELYENTDFYELDDVIIGFESELKEELVNKIETEEQLKQALQSRSINHELTYKADKFAEFRHIIKEYLPTRDYLLFLLNLSNPDLCEIEQNLTDKRPLYFMAKNKCGLVEKVASHIKDKNLQLFVSILKDDYESIINNLSFLKNIIEKPYMSRKLTAMVELLKQKRFEDENIAKLLLKKLNLKNYEQGQLDYLVKQTNDYDFIKNLVDFESEFIVNKVLLEHLFELDKDTTTKMLQSSQKILHNKHWTEIVDILNYLKRKFGKDYIIGLINENKQLFGNSSVLKSNLKKNGIYIQMIKGNLSVSVE